MANLEAPKVETPKVEAPKMEEFKKIVDSAEHSSEKNILELNNNPKLAKEEADKIAEGLPDTLDQLSPEQQKSFIKLVENDISWTNLNLAPRNVENVPDLIPPYWMQQVEAYKQEVLRIFHSYLLTNKKLLKKLKKKLFQKWQKILEEL